MKNFAAFLFCGVLTAFSARAETVVTTTTTTTTTTTSGNVTANVTYTPSVVTYAPAVSRVIVNPQAGEDELYHRHLPAPRFYGSPVLAVGAGGRPHLEQRLPPRTPPPLPPSPLLLVKNKGPGFVPALLPMRKNVPKLQGKPHLAFVDDCGAADGDGEKRSRVAEIHVGNDGLSLKIRTETLNHKRQLFAGDRGFFLKTAD